MPLRCAVAAPNSSATRVAAEVVAQGGNAVDAAVAATLAASLTETALIAPLGGGFVNIWPAGHEPVVIDGNIVMPGRDRPADRFGRGLTEFRCGYGGGITIWGGRGAVAVPGVIAALGEAVERFGALGWADVVLPTARVLRAGYPMGPAAEHYLNYTHDNLFGWHPDTTAAYHRPDGRHWQVGDLLTNDAGADALERLAERGWRDLYTGELAEALIAEMDRTGTVTTGTTGTGTGTTGTTGTGTGPMSAAGPGERGVQAVPVPAPGEGPGLVSAADLAAYRAEVRTPIRLRLGAWELALNPPPSIGGPVLAALLRLQAERGPLTPADLVDHQTMLLRYRQGHMDRAADLAVAGRELLHLMEARGRAGLPAPGSSPDTIHVSAVDSDGNACALTSSAGYGSGVTIPGTGLMLNGGLGEPELNRRGLHALSPGTRMASNMAPVTGLGPGGSVLAVGSPGADRITTALYQFLTRFCLEDLDLQAANDHARVHVHFRGQRVLVEFEDDPELDRAIPELGHDARRHPRGMFFGGIGAALRHPDGSLSAAGDPRREAAVSVG